MPTSVRRRGSTPESLFAENQGLIYAALSRRFALLSPCLREEAEQQARMGLWHAATHFDPAKGHAFSTYATHCIYGFVQHLWRRDARQNQLPCVSLDAPVPGGSERASLADFLPDPKSGLDAALDRAGFTALVSSLPPRERLLVTALYAEQQTLQEIAAALGLTRQRVYQLHSCALRRLRQTLPPPE